MALFDMPLEALKVYTPPLQTPEDFDLFWKETLVQTNNFPLNFQVEPVNYGLKTVETYDVSFAGYAGHKVKAWLLMPARQRGPLPCIVEFIGYGGGRAFPFDWLLWSSVGYAHLVMDTRGQGSSSLPGDTPDCHGEATNPHHPGFMTQGILNPNTYYYRRVFSDAVRAVQVAEEIAEVDSHRIAVTGVSQGGGIALAVSVLSKAVSAVMADVPFLCHYKRATEITNSLPYAEIARFCKVHRDKVDTVFRTLSYFDGVNFASKANARALFSVALMDDICPPSTIFAAYNHYIGPKKICIWPYNNHEGGQGYQNLEKIKFLDDLWRKT